jgi:thymidylate kinase
MAKIGKLFVFEGPDGCGKTALSRAFAENLKAAGIDAEWVSFPGQEPGTLGKHVYEIHHDASTFGVKAVNPTSLQLLHIAAHIDAIETRIIPALKKGRYVVLDRFWWSTLVYGIVNGADQRSLNRMAKIERLHWGGVRPHHMFLVRRQTPVGESLSLHLSALEKQYVKLAASEAPKYPVSEIGNDGTLFDALDLLGRLAKLEELSRATADRTTNLSQNGRGSPKNNQNVVSFPHVFTKLQPAKPTLVYETYWRFAAERQAIFFRRLRSEPPPWTSDPILREFKFTNAYRASDRTSQYLIRNVIYAGDQTPEEVFFRTLFFKFFNRIETWELITRALGQVSYREYSYAKYDSVLTKAIDSGETIYSAAYIMPSGGPSSPHGRKHRMHLKLLERMLKDELPTRLAEAPSMGKAFELLRECPTIGDFLAYQYVTDLNYTNLVNFSEMEFVVPGPGARDGIRKCFSDFGGLNEAEIIKVVAERQNAEFERLGLEFESLWRRSLQLVDCQSLFCEVDKYSRVKHPEFAGLTGRTRIKQKYRVTPAPIHHWYPPKWGLNERIAEGGLLVSSV